MITQSAILLLLQEAHGLSKPEQERLSKEVKDRMNLRKDTGTHNVKELIREIKRDRKSVMV